MLRIVSAEVLDDVGHGLRSLMAFRCTPKVAARLELKDQTWAS
eukprot:IDg6423t1